MYHCTGGYSQYKRQKGKRNRRHPDWRGRSKTPLTDDRIVNVENPMGSIKKLLELISEFSKVQGIRSMHKNQLLTHTTIWTNLKIIVLSKRIKGKRIHTIFHLSKF